MKGFVYVLTNPSLDGLVKIGYSMKDPHLRAGNDFDPAGLPDSFIVDYFALVENPRHIEGEVHRKMVVYRYKKEWFRCSVFAAIQAIRDVTDKKVLYEHIRDDRSALNCSPCTLRLELPPDADFGTAHLIPKKYIKSVPRIVGDTTFASVDMEAVITEIKISGDVEMDIGHDCYLTVSLGSDASEHIRALSSQLKRLPINSIIFPPSYVEDEEWQQIYSCEFESLLVNQYEGAGGFLDLLPEVAGLKTLSLNYKNPIESRYWSSLSRCRSLRSIELSLDDPKIIDPTALLEIPESVFLKIGCDNGLTEDWLNFFAARENLSVDYGLEGWALPFIKNHEVFSSLVLKEEDLKESKTIEILRGMTQIISLSFLGGNLNGGFFEAIRCCKMLEELHIRITDPASFTSDAFAALLDCNRIKSLWLGGAPNSLIESLRLEKSGCFISNEKYLFKHNDGYRNFVNERIIYF